MEELFSREEIVNTFALLKAILSGGTLNYKKCNCSIDDDWCPGPFGSCSTAEKCKSTSWGCGLVFWFRCDGKCKLHIKK